MAERIVALLGGDQRDLPLLPRLKAAGLTVQTIGLPEDSLPGGVKSCASIAAAVQGALLLILPLPGVRDNGRLHAPFLAEGQRLLTAEDLAACPAGTPIMVGVASPYLRRIGRELHLPVYEIAEADEVAVPNAIPTAEGALQLAMQELPLTINGLQTLVLGFGRVGEALALRLRALGAEVVIANRGSGRFAKAARQGFALYPWETLAESLGRFDAIFNTVPAMVLDKGKLLALRRDALIIDLASGGGGTDFAAAGELGLKALHALSLPGKVAPVSAGRLLGQVYPGLIRKILADKD